MLIAIRLIFGCACTVFRALSSSDLFRAVMSGLQEDSSLASLTRTTISKILSDGLLQYISHESSGSLVSTNPHGSVCLSDFHSVFTRTHTRNSAFLGSLVICCCCMLSDGFWDCRLNVLILLLFLGGGGSFEVK